MKKTVAILAMAVLSLTGIHAAETDGFVTVTCTEPGSLQLSEEALTAPCLKVVGDINAIDFVTLRRVTINVTRVLDLSECIIHEYTGTGGTAHDLSGDWMVGDPNSYTYPANTLPTQAFTEVRNNSISKFIRGSESMTKLILPAGLTGFMKESLTNNYVLTDIETPTSSVTICTEGPLVYSHDKATLLAMAPAFYGDLSIDQKVDRVASGVFYGMSPASVTFNSADMPEFGADNPINAAYIQAKNPDDYKTLFPDVDCISGLETIMVNNQEPGQLLASIGNLGYSRSDVRAVKVTGQLSYDDFTQLSSLPNLHIADLSEAKVSGSGVRDYTFSNPSVTQFLFPVFEVPLALEISTTAKLNGNLEVPEGVYWFGSTSRRFSSAVFPSTIQQIDDRLFSDYSIVEYADFSKCYRLEKLSAISTAGRLSEVRLPKSLKSLTGFGGPVKSINLPSSLDYLSTSGGWLMETLILPEALTDCYIGSLPCVADIDASEAGNLTKLRGLSNAPHLKDLDLSMCPIKNLQIFSGDMAMLDESRSQQRIVVSGGTRYPAPKVVAIENLILPSTLKTLSGLDYCSRLKGLDLMQCFRLQEIDGLNDCMNLETLCLPESLKKLSGLSNSKALHTITSCGTQAPAYTCHDDNPLEFSEITLNVAAGATGAFRMADGWENCREIKETGYRVSITDSSTSGTVKDPASLLLYGAGLYPAGSDAELTGTPEGIYSPMGWTVAGEFISGNPCVAKHLESNITASPVYGIDQSGCDVVMTVETPVDQTLTLRVNAYAHLILADNKKIDEYTGSNMTERTYRISLDAGTHQIAINGSWLCLNFEAASAGLGDGKEYRVTSFNINDKKALRQLYPQNFDMDTLDLSECPLLSYVSSSGRNRISTLNISDCPELNDVSIYYGGMDKLLFEGTPLTDIRLPHNNLTDIDLTPLRDLKYLDLSYNLLTEFKMDAPLCRNLYLDHNPMAFSTLTRQIYDIYMNQMKEEGRELYVVDFVIDTEKINETGTIDLSGLMTPPECDTPTRVYVRSREVKAVDSDGIYRVPPGNAQVLLMNDAYPDLRYVCFVNSDYPNNPTEIALDFTEVTLEAGQWFKLEATVLPEDAWYKGLIWTTSDNSIAFANSDGSLYGVAPGTAVITVKTVDGSEVAATCRVNVIEPYVAIEDIWTDPSAMKLMTGETASIRIYYSPANATDMGFVWTNTDASVVSLVQDSDITAKVTALKPGLSEIIVTNADGMVEARCIVTVEENTGVDSLYDSEGKSVYVENNVIVIDSYAEISIYSSTGHLIYKGTEKRLENLPAGVYIASGSGLPTSRKLHIH